MSQSNLHEVAIGYLLAHQAEHLHHDRHHLVQRCATHLQEQGATRSAAHITALQALGELDARGSRVYVDLSHTTCFAVFLVDPISGAKITFTAADLLRLAREQAVRAADTATQH